MPRPEDVEIAACPDCGMAAWRYSFHHPGRQYWTHVVDEDRQVCPGYLERKRKRIQYEATGVWPER